MVFLWNKERVLGELMVLARFLIGEALGVDPKFVVARVTLDGDRVIPEFSVDSTVVPVAKLHSVSPVIRDIWQGRLRQQLNARMSSVQMTRNDYQ